MPVREVIHFICILFVYGSILIFRGRENKPITPRTTESRKTNSKAPLPLGEEKNTDTTLNRYHERSPTTRGRPGFVKKSLLQGSEPS